MKKVSTVKLISSTEPDWTREHLDAFWQPSRQLLQSIRRYQRLKARKGPIVKILSKFEVMRHRFWSIVCACDIPINCQIEGGLLLPHPCGVVIHPKAKIGPNCLILQQVTIVADVSVGGHVDFGAGVKVVAPVSIGDHAVIGANAVVTKSIPDGRTAVGVPARLLGKTPEE